MDTETTLVESPLDEEAFIQKYVIARASSGVMVGPTSAVEDAIVAWNAIRHHMSGE